MSAEWTTVFDVRADELGCFEDQEFEAIFRSKLRQLTHDPKVKAVRGRVLTKGTSTSPIVGEMPVVIGYTIEIQSGETSA